VFDSSGSYCEFEVSEGSILNGWTLIGLFVREGFMENTHTASNLEDAFEKVFPWPEDVPLPIPRFGNAQSPQAQFLPPLGPQCGGVVEDRLPLALDWFDEGLGLCVRVRERDAKEELEIWAYVEGAKSKLLGKAVSVALVSEKGDRFKRITVSLDTLEGDDGCSGKKCLGTASELHAKLGEKVTVDVLLLEQSRTVAVARIADAAVA
jgi:hypothetical protein